MPNPNISREQSTLFPQFFFYLSKLNPQFEERLLSRLVDNQPVPLGPLSHTTELDCHYFFVLSHFLLYDYLNKVIIKNEKIL